AAGSKLDRQRVIVREDRAMKLLIEIAAAALLIICISVTSAAFAGPAADGLARAFSAPMGASPAARCAAIKRQCDGKFYANYCGDKLLSAVKGRGDLRAARLVIAACHAAAIKSA